MSRPNSFDDGKAWNRKGADDLLGVAEGINRAAKRDPGADTSKEVAEQAKRENWNRSDGSRNNER